MGLQLQVAFVAEHPRAVGSVLVVREPGVLVKGARGDVALAGAELDVDGAALSRVLHGRFEQRAPNCRGRGVRG